MTRAKKVKLSSITAPTANDSSTGSQPAISKAEAVRQALARGLEAPAAIVEYARTEHGVDISRSQASVYKANIKRKARERGAHAGKTKAVGRKVSVGETRSNNFGNSLLEDITAVKELVGKLGVDRVKKLAELFE